MISRSNSRDPYRSLVVLVALIALSSCSRPDTFAESPDKPAISSSVSRPEFTDDERDRINAIRNAGGLRVATTDWPGIIHQNADGSYTGFHYLLLREAAEVLDLPVEYIFVDWDDFFSIDGAIPADLRTGSLVGYSPDIFGQADLLMHSISILPWREKLMDFIPILPVRMLLLTREGEPIRQLGDLQGKRGVVFANTSHETYLKELNDRYGLDIQILTRPFGVDIQGDVAEGRADFCIRDSDTILISIADYPNMMVSMPLGRPLNNSWAVAEGDVHLASAVTKAVQYLRDANRMDTGFKANYGLSIKDYFGLINMNPQNRLELTDEEQAYLDRLRAAGGLRAAIDSEQSVYEVGEGGRTIGLHYNLALALADLLEMPLELKAVNFREFFTKDGVVDDRIKSDPDFSYMPDLIEEVDFYIATMSPLEWRKKFLIFVPIYPTKLMYMVRSDSPIPNPSDLGGLRFTILKDTSYEIWMRQTLDMSGITMVYAETGLDQARLVSEGIVDMTLSDANLALTRFDQFPNLAIYPADDEVDELSWAVGIEDEVLAGILQKALNYLKADSTFETLWGAYYKTPFSEYLELLSPGS